MAINGYSRPINNHILLTTDKLDRKSGDGQ